jgi:hypothetical protein
MQNDVDDKKQLADFYRRLASMPTEGGHRADRALIMLAERLDQDVAKMRIAASAEPQTPAYMRRRP